MTRKVFALLVLLLAVVFAVATPFTIRPLQAKPPCGQCEDHTWWDYPGSCQYQYRDCSTCTVCG
jgi:hypothetical protein